MGASVCAPGIQGFASSPAALRTPAVAAACGIGAGRRMSPCLVPAAGGSANACSGGSPKHRVPCRAAEALGIRIGKPKSQIPRLVFPGCQAGSPPHTRVILDLISPVTLLPPGLVPSFHRRAHGHSANVLTYPRSHRQYILEPQFHLRPTAQIHPCSARPEDLH